MLTIEYEEFSCEGAYPVFTLTYGTHTLQCAMDLLIKYVSVAGGWEVVEMYMDNLAKVPGYKDQITPSVERKFTMLVKVCVANGHTHVAKYAGNILGLEPCPTCIRQIKDGYTDEEMMDDTDEPDGFCHHN